MPKISWKSIGKVALDLGKSLFPIIGTVETLAKNFKKLSSKEKQDLAFEALHDELVSQLLPGEAQDPRIEKAIRNLIDAAVEVNNTIAQVRAENKEQ